MDLNKYFIGRESVKEEFKINKEDDNMERLRGFEVVKDELRVHKDCDIKIPQRGTSNSSCYDICTPVEIVIPPHSHSDLIFTDLCAYMLDDEVLMLHVRSSIGCKRGLIFANATPIIDSDYYFADNGGNIGLKFINTTDKEVVIEKGERVAQGMFIKYLTTDDDKPIKESRTGGFGHSGRK